MLNSVHSAQHWHGEADLALSESRTVSIVLQRKVARVEHPAADELSVHLQLASVKCAEQGVDVPPVVVAYAAYSAALGSGSIDVAVRRCGVLLPAVDASGCHCICRYAQSYCT